MKIRVGKTKYVYFPISLKRAGFMGPLEVMQGVSVVVLLKPSTSLEDAVESLELCIEELKLRVKQEKEGSKDGLLANPVDKTTDHTKKEV